MAYPLYGTRNFGIKRCPSESFILFIIVMIFVLYESFKKQNLLVLFSQP